MTASELGLPGRRPVAPSPRLLTPPTTDTTKQQVIRDALEEDSAGIGDLSSLST